MTEETLASDMSGGGLELDFVGDISDDLYCGICTKVSQLAS